jgi:hypothetical protein
VELVLATSDRPGTVLNDFEATNKRSRPGTAPSGTRSPRSISRLTNQTGADNKSPGLRPDIRGNTAVGPPPDHALSGHRATMATARPCRDRTAARPCRYRTAARPCRYRLGARPISDCLEDDRK